MSRIRVLLTGGAGLIAGCLLPAFRERYDLRLCDRRPRSHAPEAPDLMLAELTDAEAMARAVEGREVVVHLGGNPNSYDPWPDLRGPNMDGMIVLLDACKAAGVRRVVFASTCQTIQLPPAGALPEDVAPQPRTLYGATKTFGEAVGRFYQETHGIEFLAIRIGWFTCDGNPEALAHHPVGRRIWLGWKDCVQLFTKAVEAPPFGFAVVYGVSGNGPDGPSLENARRLLSYEPEESIERAATARVTTPVASA